MKYILILFMSLETRIFGELFTSSPKPHTLNSGHNSHNTPVHGYCFLKTYLKYSIVGDAFKGLLLTHK